MAEDNLEEQRKEERTSGAIKYKDFCTLCSQSSTLATKTFLQGQSYELVHPILQLRAWIFHSLLTIFRVFLAIADLSFWQRGMKQCDKITPAIDASEYHTIATEGELGTLLSITVLVLAVSADITVLWRQKLAYVLLPLELASLVALTLLPFNCGSMANGFLSLQVLLTFFLMTVKPSRDVLLCTIAYLLSSFGTAIFVQPNKWTAPDVMDKVTNGLLLLAVLVLMAILLSYLTNIVGEIKDARYDN